MGTVDDLILFVEIIRAGGLTAASRKIGISKSTLSRRMDDLEKALGVHLLHRGPKRFSATEVGFSVYERGLKIKDELKTVTGIVEGYTRHPTGPLRIACPKVLSEWFICDFAVAFAKEYQDVRITLDTSGGLFQAKIDHYDIVIQPVRESLGNSELISRKLFVAPYVLVGAPNLVESFGKQALSANKLDRCPGIGWGADDFSSRWKLLNQNGKAIEIDVTLTFNGSALDVIRRAALAGLGLARLPFHMCEADLTKGQLVLPLAKWSPPSVTAYALYSSRRALTLAGQRFLLGLTRHMRDSLPSFNETSVKV